MHVRPGQYTNVMQRDFIISTYAVKKAAKYQVARQDSRQGGPEESKNAKHEYSLKASTAKMDWPCYKHARCVTSKERRTTGGKSLLRWPEEMLERHSQSLSEGFRYTNGFLGTDSDCTGAIKVARSHQRRSSSL